MNQPMTMGRAVDAAIELHTDLHPGSVPYSIEIDVPAFDRATWRVEIRASHFSVPLVYDVSASRTVTLRR